MYYKIKQIISSIRQHQRAFSNSCENSMIIVPRGKHTYGPEPILLGPPYVVKILSTGSNIGKFCSIAPGLKYYFRGKHNTDWVTTYPFRAMWGIDVPLNALPPTAPIIIGNDVWIG